MKMKKLAVGVAMALSMVGGSANAALLSFEDDNIDFLLSADGTAKTSGSFAEGDILVSIFEITKYTIDAVNAIPAGMELTGVAAVQLVSGDGSSSSPWVFKQTDLGLNTWSATDVVGGGAGGGATIAMFLNPTSDDDLDLNFSSNPSGSCTDLLDCINKATTGMLLQVDGFTGDADEFWRAAQDPLFPGDAGDVADVAAAAGDVNVATFLAAQSTLFNKDGTVVFRSIASGLECPTGTAALDGCVAGPVVTGPLTGGQGLSDTLLESGAFARSDFDMSKRTVPEPGVLALLGLGFMGIALNRRRRTA